MNQPARAFLGIEKDIRGEAIADVMSQRGLEEISETVRQLAEDSGGTFEEIDLPVGPGHRLRVSSQALLGDTDEQLGRVVMFKEISHEPLTRHFEEIVDRLMTAEGVVRTDFEAAQQSLKELAERVEAAGVQSANMAELSQRVSRTQTAIANWLDVDDAMASEDYPDVSILRDRLQLAGQRWPRRDGLPRRVIDLTRAVDAYYETGDNPRDRVL